MSNPDKAQTLELVRCAVAAPSADNHHHVLFEPSSRGFRIWTDDYYQRCTEPHRKRFIEFSYGAVIENLKVKSSEFGLTFAPALFPDSSRPDLLCEIDWVPNGQGRDPLSEAVEKRHTNRRFYTRGDLDAADADQLAREVQTYAGTSLRWFDNTNDRKALLTLMRRAEAERFCRPLLHEELFSSIDWRAGWHDSCPEGLPPGALEVEVPMRPGFRLMANWSVMRVLSLLQTHQFLGLRAAWLPSRINATLGVVSSTDSTVPATIDAGRAFQRLWLRASLLDYAMQPLAASIALTLTPAVEGWAREELRAMLKDGWQRLLGSATPMMVFRIGRARPPAVRSGRRPAETYLRGSMPP